MTPIRGAICRRNCTKKRSLEDLKRSGQQILPKKKGKLVDQTGDFEDLVVVILFTPFSFSVGGASFSTTYQPSSPGLNRNISPFLI